MTAGELAEFLNRNPDYPVVIRVGPAEVDISSVDIHDYSGLVFITPMPAWEIPT